MTNQEINEKLARLDGIFISQDIFKKGSLEINVKSFPHLMPDYRTDLNLLMPLAWKYKLDVVYLDFDEEKQPEWCCSSMYETFKATDKDPKQAIIQCLLKIAEEG